MNENQLTEETLSSGTQLVYLHEDAGRVTDTGVYLAPGVENAVEVGKHLNGELAFALVSRGICAVHAPAGAKLTTEDPAPQKDKPSLEDKPNPVVTNALVLATSSAKPGMDA